MKTLVIYTHPNPKSFNAAILKTVTETLAGKGHEIRVRDLYTKPIKTTLDAADFAIMAQGRVPDDVQIEQENLLWAEALVFIYPVWWMEQPAMLKGWIDRVLSHGFAYRFGPKGIESLLKHQRALVIQTAGSPEPYLKESGNLVLMQKPMTDGTLKFCGIKNVAARTFGNVVQCSQQEREAMLLEIKNGLLKDW